MLSTCMSALRWSLLVGPELILNADKRTDGRTLFGIFHVNANALNEDKVCTSQRTVFAVVTDVTSTVAQWLRCYVTNRKVAGSIPDGVIGIFH